MSVLTESSTNSRNGVRWALDRPDGLASHIGCRSISETSHLGHMVIARGYMQWHWRPFVPQRETLLLLFKAARYRLLRQAVHVEAVSDAGIASATENLNQISDDLREDGEGPSKPHDNPTLPVVSTNVIPIPPRAA